MIKMCLINIFPFQTDFIFIISQILFQYTTSKKYMLAGVRYVCVAPPPPKKTGKNPDILFMSRNMI